MISEIPAVAARQAATWRHGILGHWQADALHASHFKNRVVSPHWGPCTAANSKAADHCIYSINAVYDKTQTCPVLCPWHALLSYPDDSMSRCRRHGRNAKRPGFPAALLTACWLRCLRPTLRPDRWRAWRPAPLPHRRRRSDAPACQQPAAVAAVRAAGPGRHR